MRETLEIGSTPCNEDCAQVGSDNYASFSKLECQVYIRQLQQQFPRLLTEDGIDLIIKSFPHDFGTYREVCIVFDFDDENAANLAYEIEGNLPEDWTEESKAKLAELKAIVSKM